MALTDQVIMPGADYQAAANQVRTLNGTTATLKSGEMVTALEGANTEVTTQTAKINALIQQANDLPDAGGTGGTDIALGITGATVGQIAKITAVDSNGKPTAWTPVDMPSGGASEEYELIRAITIADGAAESNTLTINTDESGSPFSLKKAKIFGIFPAYKGNSTRPNFSFFMLNGVSSGANSPYCYTSGWETVTDNVSRSCSVEVDLTKPGMQEETAWRSNSNCREYFGPAKIESITSIGGTNMLIYPGCQFWLYGVRS